MTLHESGRASEAWRIRVESAHAQSRRIMDESREMGDIWRTLAPTFRADPLRTGDVSLNAISTFVDRDSTVLDVGGGAGRFAIALAFRSRSVTVVDPSKSMLKELHDATAEANRPNVQSVFSEWQDAVVEPSDIVLCSHVLYGIADVRTFIEKLSTHARRRVVMLSFVDSPQSKVAPLWEPVHGEPRITFPALTEIANVLWEMGIYPDIEMLPPPPPRAFDTIEETLDEIRRMMFITDRSEASARLDSVVDEHLEQTELGFRLKEGRMTREGVITWEV